MRSLRRLIWGLGLGLALLPGLAGATTCNGALGLYRSERSAVDWYDPASEHVHAALDAGVQPATLKKLQPRFSRIKEALEGAGWSPRRFKPSPDFQDKRMGLSTTISGTNPNEQNAARQAQKNWLKAEALVAKWVRNGEALTRDHMFTLNRVIGDGLFFNGNEAGVMRNSDVGVEHSEGFQNAHAPEDIEKAMHLFELWYQAHESNTQPLVLAAAVGQRLNSIHPFPDANGRTTRLITDWVLMRNGYPPALYENREETNSVIFPRDVIGANSNPDTALENLTKAVERSMEALSLGN